MSEETYEEARRLVDVFLRPYYEQPFEVGTEIEIQGVYTKVPFYYTTAATLGYAWVNVDAKTVVTEDPAEL